MAHDGARFRRRKRAAWRSLLRPSIRVQAIVFRPIDRIIQRLPISDPQTQESRC
ncbi:MAG: hypothetical protein BSOLF_0826 [Candidatus Carbobacillus altaicus]|uniref:Uncharacterized protein n=1 Tax=Candidatus Carbonibacillus altaicus TaxID=2163959 RepID=A0A2R6Y097_9BACL|nr:MAG: hypothetical protein BSOLF_0826 [Candidatus Carbobacillus altaicus]